MFFYFWKLVQMQSKNTRTPFLIYLLTNRSSHHTSSSVLGSDGVLFPSKWSWQRLRLPNSTVSRSSRIHLRLQNSRLHWQQRFCQFADALYRRDSSWRWCAPYIRHPYPLTLLETTFIQANHCTTSVLYCLPLQLRITATYVVLVTIASVCASYKTVTSFFNLFSCATFSSPLRSTTHFFPPAQLQRPWFSPSSTFIHGVPSSKIPRHASLCTPRLLR